MRTFLIVALLATGLLAYGQTYQLRGELLDENAQPLPSAGAVLLDPSDSTLLYFSVTGNDGRFEMKNIRRGAYLLQVSLIGYNTLYRAITMPLPGGEDAGTLIMTPRVYDVEGVVVTRDRIPMKMKYDTIEYDAKAFKVKPDAVAEELLKKLPGIEIDRAGNIKAMGEDVNNVLVDGKEFFGNDPKVATRNLPAGAIDKVQVFDKQTDESAFTGIDDGQRNPTLNFVLDEDKKSGIFGDVSAGGGTGGHTAAAGKIYRFTATTQFAALGMFNNINQFGFSINDYINFSGGMAAMSSGGGHVMLDGGNSFPVNFGQPIYGTGSNGAAGLNFSVSNERKDRFFASYLGNGSRRNLSETSTTRNYIPDGTFLIDETKEQVQRDTAHRLNFGLRKLIGERQNLIVNGGVSYNTASNPLSSLSGSYLNEVKVNGLESSTNQLSSRFSGNADASYMVKINEGRTVLKVTGRAAYSGSDAETRFNNRTEYLNPYSLEVTNQFYNLGSQTENYTAGLSLTQKVSQLSYIDFAINAGYSSEDLMRRQGDISGEMVPLPMLSPDFIKTESSVRPGITWKRSTTKSQLTLAVVTSLGEYSTELNDTGWKQSGYLFLTPKASWEYEYRSGRRLMLDYSSAVTTPGASQLLPVVNNINSLSLFYGNRDLRPEYSHTASASWWLFDQFSFTTLLTGMSMRYTRDRTGYARTVDENLGQTVSLINVKDDWRAGANIDFSTPFKPLGIKVNLSLDEEYNRGMSIINGTENISSGFTHRVSLTVDNRKKEKWDIETGSAVTFTSTSYSVQSMLNNNYHDISWFAEARYTPGVHFSFMASADITSYSAGSFSESRLVPLTGAEVSYYFMKNQRASLTLAGVDLLNRNRGIERISEMNYLVERRSDIIGRYVMLSFRYRLNKSANANGGVDVQVKRR